MRKLRWSGMAALAACALAALPAAAQANVQVGSSGWLWGNPLPQGNTLRAMAFAGTTGYAVGDFGTLLKTTDAGDTWTGLPAGTFSNLTEVQVLDANTVVAGGGCVARLSTDGGQTFSRIAFTPVESSCPDGSHLAALSYVNAQHGYLVLNDGSVFETTDGQQFATKTAIPGTKQAGGGVVPTDAAFTSDTGGYVTTSDGNIYVTTDSGVSWKSVSATNRPVRAITFASASVGYAVGDSSLFLKTSDGGATWVAEGDRVRLRTSRRSAAPMRRRASPPRRPAPSWSSRSTAPGRSRPRRRRPIRCSPPRSRRRCGSRPPASRARRSSLTTRAPTRGGSAAGWTGSFSRIVAGEVRRHGLRARPQRRRSARPSTAARPGRAATSRRRPTSWTSRSRRPATATRSTSPAGCSSRRPAAASGRRWTPAARRGRARSTRRRRRPSWSSGRPVCAAPSTAAGRSTRSRATRSPARQLQRVDRAGGAVVAYGLAGRHPLDRRGQDVEDHQEAGQVHQEGQEAGEPAGRAARRLRRCHARLPARHERAAVADVQRRVELDRAAGRRARAPHAACRSPRRRRATSSSAASATSVSRRASCCAPTTAGRRGIRSSWCRPRSPMTASWPAAATDYLLGGQQSLLYSTTGGDSGASSELTIAAPKTRYGKATHIAVTGQAGARRRATSA